MPTYRAYRVDDHQRIRTGDWIEASNDAEAIAQAEELCDEETPRVEVWQAARLVEQVDCEDVTADEGAR